MHDALVRSLILTSFLLLAPAVCAQPEAAPATVDLTLEAVRTVALLDTGKPLAWGGSVKLLKNVKAKVAVRAVFRVEDLDRFASLTVDRQPDLAEVTLNGMDVLVPVPGMTYKKVPGVLPALLKKGENTLSAAWTVAAQTVKEGADASYEVKASDLPLRLFGLTPRALAFQTGPVLGYAGPEFFTVTCRTNMPSMATLAVNGRTYASATEDLLHVFKAEGLQPGTEYTYTLSAHPLDHAAPMITTGPHSVRTLPTGGKLTFVAMGDNRSFPLLWASVGAAVAKARPAFALFVGDFMDNGRMDWQWDEQLFGPAAGYFATVPTYPVLGNHEQNSPLFTRVFALPGGGKNWAQEIGPALFIGIDGAMNWTADGPQAKWLEETLAPSKARFIFLASHYPGWSSGSHGRVKEDGAPRELTTAQARSVILPLLKKYKATAMFVGHDHHYERVEPPDGVPQIITGGAGAPLSPPKVLTSDSKQNPYSRVFASTLHYCVLTLDGDTCTMEVVTPEGKVIDACVWKARQ